MTTIPPTAAALLRDALSRIQAVVMRTADISEAAKWKLVESISSEGFQLVDELEGVMR